MVENKTDSEKGDEQHDSSEEKEVADDLSDLFPDSSGRYDFMALQKNGDINSRILSDRLWDAVWQGQVSNDTFAALRRGIENKFKVKMPREQPTSARRRGWRSIARSGFAAWKGSIPYSGNWFKLPVPERMDDLIEAEELKKDRVRQLLDRYGILFRELLLREIPVFRWASVFRSLRLMELSGEILAGYFFKGIPGPQFISHKAFRILQSVLNKRTHFRFE